MAALTNTIAVTGNTTKISATNSEVRTFTGSGIIADYREIGTTEEEIELGALTDSGQIFIRNAGPTNFLEVGFATGVYPVRIKTGGASLIPLNPATDTIYVKADTSAVMVSILAQQE